MKYKAAIASPWDEVTVAHALVILRYQEEKWVDAYTEQANLVKWVVAEHDFSAIVLNVCPTNNLELSFGPS